VSLTLKQGRESRLWCMLVSEMLERGATLTVALDLAAPLIEDEASPTGAPALPISPTSFARLRAPARRCASAQTAIRATDRRR
jgi:hypothetical protein